MTRLPRPCLDCGTLVSSTRCRRCQTRRERQRGTTAQRGYHGGWDALSRRLTAEVGYCEQCGAQPTPGNPLTVDHRLPLSMGGSNDRGNLVVLCRRCNSSKGATAA